MAFAGDEIKYRKSLLSPTGGGGGGGAGGTYIIQEHLRGIGA